MVSHKKILSMIIGGRVTNSCIWVIYFIKSFYIIALSKCWRIISQNNAFSNLSLKKSVILWLSNIDSIIRYYNWSKFIQSEIIFFLIQHEKVGTNLGLCSTLLLF